MVLREGVEKIINSKSKTFLAFCFCFLFGVAVASLADLDEKYVIHFYRLLLIVIFFIALCWNKRKYRYVFIVLAIFSTGCLRYLIAVPNAQNSLGQDTQFTAKIVSEPKITLSQTEYVVKSKILRNKILAKLPSYPEYHYGDLLNITCYLDEPYVMPGSDFRYDKYLLSQGVSAACVNASAQFVGHHNSFLGNIYALKGIVAEKVAVLWPEPESSLIGGLLYGDRVGMPKDITDNFSRVGLSHIVAVSGYNITIIAAALMIILISVGLYRRQAFWVAIFSIFIYVIFTGASASAVRAGIMGSVILIGQYIGRPSRVSPALILAASLMVLVNPYILISDVGFQLSFAATAGIIFLASGTSVVKTTLAAVSATLPLILFHFGRLSIVALPVNILVLWLIPYLMLFGFMAIISSWVFLPIGQILAWLTGFGLKYILIIVDVVGRQSWSSVEWQIPWWLLLLLYLLLYRVYLWQNKKLS
ncbi:MAG: ComEC/Rec2 family competence protein [Candidatus Magasanikbacteria bacterium]|nr:ComEC/Rec2 family competence protein [Candidatus Magasanikbacteria bacterium]